MKKLLGIVSVMLVMFTAIAQAQTYRNVTINVVGSRIKQVGVDNQVYPINNTSMTGEQEVNITNLQNGQHRLNLYRSTTGNPSATTFTLREGYDMTINVTSNGSIRISESRTRTNDGGAISNAAFNKIYAATKNKSSSTSRTSYLQTEFAKTNRMFTAQQARSLIQLVNSENSRFTLAKLVYVKVTDKSNFSLVTSLLNSSSNRTALNNYIATVPVNDDEDTNAAYVAMNQQRFNVVYNEVLAESASDRNFYLMNFFNKDFNYYTSNQVKQLLQLVSSESERFGLAKLAYRGITDKDNYYNEMYSLLNSTNNRNELRTYLSTYDQNNNTRPGMTSTAFNSLYQTIYNQSSSTTKYNSINTAFTNSGNYFTVAQAKQLIQMINDENARLALAKASFRTLVDRANYTQLNDLFNYQTTRNNFISYVQNFDSTTPGSTVAVPMADAEFNTLYRNVNNAWTTTSRYNLVLTAFQSTTNYFSASQVKQLLLLISSETDKLALAKIAYDNLTDPFNYTQVSDVFSSTSTRTEWSRYVTDVQNGGTGTGVGTNTPMSETDFNTLYRNVSGAWSSSSKYSLVATAFQNTSNYFNITQVRQLLLQISNESEKLTLAKTAFDNVTDPFNYTQLNDVFSTTSSRTEWARYVTDVQNGGTGTGVGTNTPMSETDFNTLYRNVSGSWSSSSKYSLVATAFQNTANYFTIAQVRQLLQQISTESEKMTLAKAAFDNVTDPFNYSQLNDVFTTSENRTEWARYVTDIQNGGTGVGAKIAMTDSEYKSLYRSVQLTFGFGAKMSNLMDIFNKETNYFTTEQIKELITLVSSETNRLELAKLAYNNAVDPQSYSVVADVLTSQSSRDELNVYIGTNR